MADLPTGQPQAMPGAGPQAAPGNAAFGSAPTPATTPNNGQSAAGLQLMAVMQNLTLMILKQVGPSSPAGADMRKVLDLVSKHVPAGSVSPAGETNAMAALQAKQQQQNPQIAQMQAMAARQAGGGAQPPQAAA